MNSVKDSIAQAKMYVEYFGERITLLEKLGELDSRIDALQKGQAPVAQAPAPVKVPVAVNGGNGAAANGNGAPKRRGRPKGSKNKGKPAAAPQAPQPAPVQPAAQPSAEDGRKRFANQLSLKKLIIKICSRHPSGIKLEELAKKCYEAGYRSTSNEKGFVQNIRTNLHSLLNKGVLTKDQDKKYHKQQQEPAAQVAPPVQAAAPAEQLATA